MAPDLLILSGILIGVVFTVLIVLSCMVRHDRLLAQLSESIDRLDATARLLHQLGNLPGQVGMRGHGRFGEK